MSDVTRQELELLHSCTASVDVRLDCDHALRGDETALARCAEILRRARPSGVPLRGER